MKIITMDLDSIILYLSDMDFSLEENIDVLEEKFREIFLHLKGLYDIDIKGYYRIDIYKDKFYGVIVEIEKEEFEYFDCFDNQVDMRISIHDDFIFYEFDDFFSVPETLSKKLQFYIYHDKIYGKLNDFVSEIDGSKLQEYSSSVLYGSNTKYILQKKNNIERN